MRVGLLSDTHGDPTAWGGALDVFGDVGLILHAGDVLYHGVFNPISATYEPRKLAGLLNSCNVPMLHARGNCDSEVDQLALDNHILSDFAFASVEDVRILVCHGHKWQEKELAEMAARAGVDIVHRGHTHLPELETIDGVVFVNAGSCALPKQEGSRPTVAVLEDRRISIFDIETGESYLQAGLP